MPRKSRDLTEREIEELEAAMNQYEESRNELFVELNFKLREVGERRDHRLFALCDEGGYGTQLLVTKRLGWNPGTISALKHRRGVHKGDRS
jgi:hypothetical protein